MTPQRMIEVFLEAMKDRETVASTAQQEASRVGNLPTDYYGVLVRTANFLLQTVSAPSSSDELKAWIRSAETWQLAVIRLRILATVLDVLQAYIEQPGEIEGLMHEMSSLIVRRHERVVGQDQRSVFPSGLRERLVQEPDLKGFEQYCLQSLALR